MLAAVCQLLYCSTVLFKVLYVRLKMFYLLILVDRWLVYNIGLISVIHQYELTIGVHMSSASSISLPQPAQSHLSRLSQSPSLSSLSHTTNSHWLSVCIPGGGYGNPLQYSCLENAHGPRSMASYSPWGRKESDMTEWVSTAQHIYLHVLVYVHPCYPLHFSFHLPLLPHPCP